MHAEFVSTGRWVEMSNSSKTTMRAAVYQQYGPPEVVHIANVPKPTIKPDQVLIKIHATTVNSADWRLRSMQAPAGYRILVRLALGVFKPRNQILGMESSGVVEAIGSKVTKFAVGDRVLSGGAFGNHAEFRTVKETGSIALMPEELGFAEAAALAFGGSTALSFLQEKANIGPGDKLLINGASGAVGIASIQIAKYFGAQVTAVCSAANFDLVRSLGADHVIDYHQQDFTQNGEIYDIIMDNVGNAPWQSSKNSLSDTGHFLAVIGPFSDLFRAPLVSKKGGKSMHTGSASANAEQLALLAQFAVDGIFQPHINQSFTLDEIAAAHTLVDTGHKTGSVVIQIVEQE